VAGIKKETKKGVTAYLSTNVADESKKKRIIVVLK